MSPGPAAVFVPINHRLAPVEILYWLNDSGSTVLFVDDAFLAAIADIRDRLEKSNTSYTWGMTRSRKDIFPLKSWCQGMHPSRRHSEAAMTWWGFSIRWHYGRSKGVMLSHRNLTYNVLQSQARPSSGRKGYLPARCADVSYSRWIGHDGRHHDGLHPGVRAGIRTRACAANNAG